MEEKTILSARTKNEKRNDVEILFGWKRSSTGIREGEVLILKPAGER